MATQIVNALKTLNPELVGDAETQSLSQWTQICNSSILHLVAQILVSATVAPGIPTAGGPTSQVTTGPGTATGSIS